MVRIPCNDFKNWQRVNGFDDTGVGQALRRRSAAPAPTCGSSPEGELRGR